MTTLVQATCGHWVDEFDYYFMNYGLCQACYEDWNDEQKRKQYCEDPRD